MRTLRRKLRLPESGWGVFRFTKRGPVKLARFDTEDAAYAEMKRRQADGAGDNLMVTHFVTIDTIPPFAKPKPRRPQADSKVPAP